MSNEFVLPPAGSGAEPLRSPRLQLLNREFGIHQRRPRGLSNDAVRRAIAALDVSTIDLALSEDVLLDFIAPQPQPMRHLFTHFALPPETDAARMETALSEDSRRARLMLRNIKEFCRRRRQAQFHRRYCAGEDRPILISDGDSWFHFPVFLRDVTIQLSSDHLVWPLASAGDTLKNMVFGDETTNGRRYVRGLNDYGHEADAFLFSGGGNDLIGIDPDGSPALLSYVRPYERGRSAAWFIDTPEFRRRVTYIEATLRHVFAEIAALRPKLPVLIHGYDYVLPWPCGPDDRRNPKWTRKDHFFGSAVRKLGIHDPVLQTDIARSVIDAINDLQRRLAGGNVRGGAFAHVFHVDVRCTIKRDEWADEIHPMNCGYARVANRFRSVLAGLGISGR